jgi:hypothetical protein
MLRYLVQPPSWLDTLLLLLLLLLSLMLLLLWYR